MLNTVFANPAALIGSGGSGTGSTGCSIRTGTPPVADEVLLVENTGGYLECEQSSCSGRYVAVSGKNCINTKNKKCKENSLYMCSLGVNDSWVDKGVIKQCADGKTDTGNMHKVLLDKDNKKYENYVAVYSLSDLQKVCWTWGCNSGFKFDGNTKKCVSNTQSSTTPKNEVVENKPQSEQVVQPRGSEDKKIGQSCSKQYAKRAVWQKVGKEIKCVAKECNPNRYLVVNSKGESQGYCIANTCKAPQILNIIDGTKTDKRCVDPAALEIVEETIEEEIEEELSPVPVRPDLQINQPCAQGFLTILNAKTGKYAKHASSDDIYCDITECNENFVKVSRNQGETYNVGDATLELQYEICECPNATHTINNEGKCVANTNGVPATDRTPSEDNVSITVTGTIEFEGKGNTCPENVDISVPEGANKTQNECGFTVGLQTAGEIAFSAEGYESVTKSYSESVDNETIVLNKSATDVTDDEDDEDVVSPEVPVEGDEQEEVDEEDKIQELRDKSKAAHERENSMANKMLGAAGIGATGIGGMMLMQGMAEQKADGNAEEQMRAYLSTFMCRFGDGRAKGGESDIELPGANALLPLYSEYVTLANETKAMKTELDLKPGIESESILDNATSGLYDDENSGKTSGAFASLARALQNPDGEDAKKWAEQTEKASKNVKTGAITAGAGAVGSLVGHIAESTAYKKKAEKGTEDSDDESEDKKYKPKKRGKS